MTIGNWFLFGKYLFRDGNVTTTLVVLIQWGQATSGKGAYVQTSRMIKRNLCGIGGLCGNNFIGLRQYVLTIGNCTVLIVVRVK